MLELSYPRGLITLEVICSLCPSVTIGDLKRTSSQATVLYDLEHYPLDYFWALLQPVSLCVAESKLLLPTKLAGRSRIKYRYIPVAASVHVRHQLL